MPVIPGVPRGASVMTSRRNGHSSQKGAALCFLVTLWFAGHPLAAPVVEYESLEPVTANLRAPCGVAFDSSGNLLVTESRRGRILVYDANHAPIRTIAGLHRPVAIAVAASGELLVADAETGSVEIFSRYMKHLGRLGSGLGEFGRPVGVAAGLNGNIYVADGGKNEVSVYGPERVRRFCFEKPDGGFRSLSALAINEQLGEVVVADMPTLQTEAGPVAVARIQTFDLEGRLRRSFFLSPPESGSWVYRPTGLAVDGRGNLYIADALQQVVHVLDGNGKALGIIHEPRAPLRSPLGVAMRSDGLLYVASMNGAAVQVFQVSISPPLKVTPLSLSIVASHSESSMPWRSVRLWNHGVTRIGWSMQNVPPWLVPATRSGSLQGSSWVDLEISIDHWMLDLGRHSASVKVESASGESATFNVYVEIVEGNPVHRLGDETPGLLLTLSILLGLWIVLRRTSGSRSSPGIEGSSGT